MSVLSIFANHRAINEQQRVRSKKDVTNHTTKMHEYVRLNKLKI